MAAVLPVAFLASSALARKFLLFLLHLLFLLLCYYIVVVFFKEKEKRKKRTLCFLPFLFSFECISSSEHNPSDQPNRAGNPPGAVASFLWKEHCKRFSWQCHHPAVPWPCCQGGGGEVRSVSKMLFLNRIVTDKHFHSVLLRAFLRPVAASNHILLEETHTQLSNTNNMFRD